MRQAHVAFGLIAFVSAGVLMTGTRVSGQQAQPPVFRASSTYVSLDVVVTDRNDRPITTLRQDEFIVIEKGRRQTIADFAAVNIPPSFRPRELNAPPEPASDVAVNTITRNASRAMSIVVDDTSLPPTSLLTIKRVLKSMIEVLAPDDQVSFTYVGRSDLSRDFTSDHGRLMESVNSLGDALGLPPAAQARMSDAGGDDGGPPPLGLRPVQMTGLSTPPLHTVLWNVIATLSSARQSRRSIILVNTSGCNPADRTFGDLCKNTIKRAVQAGVPIYGLNPLGLMDAMSSEGAGAYDSVEGRTGIQTGIDDANDSLKILASETGGRAFVQSNLQMAVESVMSDNGNFYVIGYYPDPRPTDGKFHDVEVRVTRPGLRVRSKAGYMADGGKSRSLSVVGEMTKHLGEGLPDPGLAMRAFVAPYTVGRKGSMAVVTAELAYPIPDGGFSGDFKDEWRMGVLALDSDGKIKASFQRPMSFTGKWKPNAKGIFVLNEIVDLPRSTVSVRVGVTSQLLGRTGTVHVPITVPNFSDKDLQISPLVLGQDEEFSKQVDAALGLDRLRGILPFVPTTRRTFAATQSLRLHTKASWRSKDTTIEAEVQVIGGVDLPGGLKRPFVVTTDRKGQHHALLDCTLPLAGLEPGAYVLRVTARLSGGESVTRDVPFSIQ